MKRIAFVVEGARPTGQPKRTWKDIVEGDMKSLKINKKDGLVQSKWRRLITDTEGNNDDVGLNV